MATVIIEPGVKICLKKGINRFWRILKVDTKKQAALVISERFVDRRPFNDTLDLSVTWNTSSIRRWLNNEYFVDEFSEEERRAIFNVHIKDMNCVDKVFLLSLKEVNEYLNNSLLWVPEGDEDDDFWLRTRADDNKGFIYASDYFGRPVARAIMTLGMGVRPCIWIDMNLFKKERCSPVGQVLIEM